MPHPRSRQPWQQRVRPVKKNGRSGYGYVTRFVDYARQLGKGLAQDLVSDTDVYNSDAPLGHPVRRELNERFIFPFATMTSFTNLAKLRVALASRRRSCWTLSIVPAGA
jgi:hypothetical protein